LIIKWLKLTGHLKLKREGSGSKGFEGEVEWMVYEVADWGKGTFPLWNNIFSTLQTII